MQDLNLNNESFSPLYQQLKNRMRQDIAAGVYPLHSRIPSEQELCTSYHVSRVTVRKALLELTEEGLLERRRGKGTFVSAPRLQRNLSEITSFSRACSVMGVESCARLVHAGWIQADHQASSLKVNPEDLIVEITRLRLADGEPVVLEQNCFSERYGWLLNEKLNGSLYDLLKMRHIYPSHATHEISLVYADGNEARLLGISPGTALLCLRELIEDQDGQPLHTSIQKIRGDRFTFRI